ncbi:MAG: DUF4388 domain-containing protein [Myxococcaceae bacterium]|nr:DUF4388 domain-containing protein [Myxococcaceae bacterium]
MATGRKILLAVPDPAAVRTLTRALRQRGFQVSLAPDGARALEVAVLRHPHIVLFDEACGGIEARAFAQILTSNPRTEHVPVLLLTAQHDLEILRHYRDGFLRKPFNIDEAVSRIEHLCRRGETARELKGDGKEIEGGLAQLPLPDLLQILSMNRRTGRLAVEQGGVRGEIFLTSGQPKNARLNEVDGEKAFFRMLTWKEGAFAFTPGPPTARVRIDRPMEDALLEGARHSDERARWAPQLPAPESVVALAPGATLPIEPHPVTAEVLRVVSRPRRVSEVLDAAQAPDLEIMAALVSLLERKVLRVEDDDAAAAGPLLEPAEVHALRGRILRGRIATASLVVKVFVIGTGPKAGKHVLKTLRGLVAVASQPSSLRSGFGTLGRIEVSEALKVDVCMVPSADAARPLWRPFAAGAVGALLLDDDAPAMKLAQFFVAEQRLPAIVSGNGSGDHWTVLTRGPVGLKRVPAPTAVPAADLQGALKMLLRLTLAP